MSEENPNPRGFRAREVFIDLASIAAVVWAAPPPDPIDGEAPLEFVGTYRPCTRVLFSGAREWVSLLSFTPSDHHALLDALEIYRSGR